MRLLVLLHRGVFHRFLGFLFLIKGRTGMTRRGLLIIDSIPLMLIGAFALWLHYEHYVSNAEFKANYTIGNIEETKKLGAVVETFRKRHGRLPNMEDLNCKSAPCKPYTFITESVKGTNDGYYEVKHVALGVPFSPAFGQVVTWYSKDGSTDHDYLDQPWKWKLMFVPWALLDLTIVFLLSPYAGTYGFIKRHIKKIFGKDTRP